MTTEPALLPSCVTTRAVASSRDDGEALATDVAGRVLAACLAQLAEFAGWRGGADAWRRDNAGRPVAARTGSGEIVVELGAWIRTATGAAGASVVPTRTAASFGLPRAALTRRQVPRSRLLDLWGSRRRQRRWRRYASKDLAAGLARTELEVERFVATATDRSDDGRTVEQLPAYAVASRVTSLLDTGPDWTAVAAAWVCGTPDQIEQATVLLGAVVDAALELLGALPDVDGAAGSSVDALVRAARGA